MPKAFKVASAKRDDGFAGDHVETHRWQDSRTMLHLADGRLSSATTTALSAIQI